MTVLIHRVPAGRPGGVEPLIGEARERQRRRRRRLATFIVVAVGAGAIGYGISRGASGHAATRSLGSARAGLPRPCALLTNAEVKNFVGSAIQNRSAQTPAGMPSSSRFRMCTWTGAPLSSFRSEGNRLVIMVLQSTREQFLKTARGSPGAVAIRGLGELAYAIRGPARFLNVFEDGYTFTFQIGAVNPIETEKQVAKVVLSRVR